MRENFLWNDLFSVEMIKNPQDSGISNLLSNAIKRYQFEVVGWAEYCNDNTSFNQKALPLYRQNPLENLRIRDRILNPLGTPPLKKVYETPKHYIKHLDEEYVRDQAFYEAILENPGKFNTDDEDILLNKEIDQSAKKYLKTIDRRKVDEEELIRDVQNDDWRYVKVSNYPKVQLGPVLGAAEDAIVNNFGVYFINQLKAQFAGSRTAFLSSSGPESWHELDKCKAELSYFKKEIVKPAVKKLHPKI
jgi:hypothetical protein